MSSYSPHLKKLVFLWSQLLNCPQLRPIQLVINFSRCTPQLQKPSPNQGRTPKSTQIYQFKAFPRPPQRNSLQHYTCMAIITWQLHFCHFYQPIWTHIPTSHRKIQSFHLGKWRYNTTCILNLSAYSQRWIHPDHHGMVPPSAITNTTKIVITISPAEIVLAHLLLHSSPTYTGRLQPQLTRIKLDYRQSTNDLHLPYCMPLQGLNLNLHNQGKWHNLTNSASFISFGGDKSY